MGDKDRPRIDYMAPERPTWPWWIIRLAAIGAAVGAFVGIVKEFS